MKGGKVVTQGHNLGKGKGGKMGGHGTTAVKAPAQGQAGGIK